MLKLIIAIIVACLVELILGIIIIKNPNKIMDEGNSDKMIKVFVFIILSVMILALVYLTISGIQV
jgi:hypothetical protein